jgi:hypothetical protein
MPENEGRRFSKADKMQSSKPNGFSWLGKLIQLKEKIYR